MRRTGRKNGVGGSSSVWQIIYMDLMTIMMVYFVILWSADQGKAAPEQAGISHTIGDQTVRMVNLPGDILFRPGKSFLSAEGQQVFTKLFGEDPGTVLSFDTGGLARRQLVVHGHTDSDGVKDENFRLGFERAWSVYREIRKYSDEVPDHVVICTHADNSPRVVVPVVKGPLTPEEKQVRRELKARNRRITIEDQMVNAKPEE